MQAKAPAAPAQPAKAEAKATGGGYATLLERAQAAMQQSGGVMHGAYALRANENEELFAEFVAKQGTDRDPIKRRRNERPRNTQGTT